MMGVSSAVFNWPTDRGWLLSAVGPSTPMALADATGLHEMATKWPKSWFLDMADIQFGSPLIIALVSAGSVLGAIAITMTVGGEWPRGGKIAFILFHLLEHLLYI